MRFLRERLVTYGGTFTTIRNANFEVSAMWINANKVRLVVSAVVVVAALTVLGTAAAQKASAPKPQDRLAIGEQNIRQLLLLMNTDKNGMVSKEEYTRFMDAEFHRLDKENRGELNALQLNQSTLSASHFTGK
jgi:hypothetical protein